MKVALATAKTSSAPPRRRTGRKLKGKKFATATSVIFCCFYIIFILIFIFFFLFLGDPPVATCDGCVDDLELGRLLTTVFQPSDFAFNACGGNACVAQDLADALSGNFSCLYEFYDYGRGGGDSLFPCGFAPNPPNAYIVSSANWTVPDWYSDNYTVQENMTNPAECQAACAMAEQGCDFFSFEWELGIGECLFKSTLPNCTYEPYTRWAQKWDDPFWSRLSAEIKY